ncbi:bifunctional 4-hydroxy-2-oxoglutarate aldolase/2-dehydro-3-deoxy-phosphogluconate aldolase [Actinomadura flavalba]|uniref:bifunctional 4-hydroxy-2-oxoglutarate aldolase/2-dehydro-3-deoxy-phosphogluconate aldolase n=1 Tax=Actinomadura flavalba TaxID=1120938 RepID=UPI0003A89AB4|nr:bifunctional 4-hydroxy-2-oxoglutarate aldolase/2-dehydro-3-deoxy-phosphogluconate aldolase [Actinomadura flavalba]
MNVLAEIGRAGVLPVIRRASADEAVTLCTTLLDLGAPVLELTATTPGWPDVLASVRALAPAVPLGVGTVTDARTARDAVAAGADFLVSPYPADAVRAVADRAIVPFVEGGFTPGELAGIVRRGGVAKLFPAASGGPGHLRAVLDVLPGARIIPTGGIAVADVPAWLAAGAFAVGVGSALADAGAAPPAWSRR